jgi:hypothetical protein
LLPQLPQFSGSLSGFTQSLSQHMRDGPHDVEPAHPLPNPLLEEPAPELLPEVLPPDPPLVELPPDPLVDPPEVLLEVSPELVPPDPVLDVPPELPDVPAPLLEVPGPPPLALLVAAPEDPLDPPTPPLPPDVLDAPLLVDAVVPSTEASLGPSVNSVPPQRTAAKITASKARSLRVSFMAQPL